MLYVIIIPLLWGLLNDPNSTILLALLKTLLRGFLRTHDNKKTLDVILAIIFVYSLLILLYIHKYFMKLKSLCTHQFLIVCSQHYIKNVSMCQEVS